MKLKPPKISKEVKEKLDRENPEQWIPYGLYCYDGNVLCPYWTTNPKARDQEYGYCYYLKAGDWMSREEGGTSLLWDQCKECSINEDEVA